MSKQQQQLGGMRNAWFVLGYMGCISGSTWQFCQSGRARRRTPGREYRQQKIAGLADKQSRAIAKGTIKHSPHINYIHFRGIWSRKVLPTDREVAGCAGKRRPPMNSGTRYNPKHQDTTVGQWWAGDNEEPGDKTRR
ncbi:hypothetical protein EDB19DRAFT_1822851 [Suillus lakei]|nr:hypothetical protein EDB19DRAFT_1822851 [Suillus lakei]